MIFIGNAYIIVCILTSRYWYLPYADNIIRVASKKSLAICRPSEWQALWINFGAAARHNFWAQFFDNFFACQIPNLDGWSVGNAEPVAIRWEAWCGNDVIMIQCMQQFILIKIPEECFAVLATRCAQRAIGRNGYSVQVTRVTGVADTKFAVCQVPYFNGAIPTTWNNNRIWVIGRKANARNPIAVAFLLNCVLAFGKSIPQLDGFVTWTRHNLTIIDGECDG